MDSQRRRVLAVIGGLNISVGLLTAAYPNFVIDIPVLSSLIAVTGRFDVHWIAVVSFVVLGASLVRMIGRGSEENVSGESTSADQFDRLARASHVSARMRGASPETCDTDVSLAVAGHEDALESIRNRLRAVAIARLVRKGSNSPMEAKTEIEAGTWTRDPVAAAFLDSSSHFVQGLSNRLRYWIDSEEERRRLIGRTIMAIERITAHQTEHATDFDSRDVTASEVNERFTDVTGWLPEL